MYEMDDSTLIALVQNYEELFNINHKDYSNHPHRDIIWKEIAKTVKQPHKQCRERWTRIRENYRKALTLRKTKTGEAASKIKAPKFEKELSFLIPYLGMGDESDHSNIPPSSTSVQQKHEFLETNDFDDQNLSNLSIPSDYNTSGNMNHRIIRKRGTEEKSVAAVLQDYLEMKKYTMNKISLTEDHLTHFFINMAQTVKTFPLRDQIEIKQKLFEMVTSVEMRIARYFNEPETLNQHQ